MSEFNESKLKCLAVAMQNAQKGDSLREVMMNADRIYDYVVYDIKAANDVRL